MRKAIFLCAALAAVSACKGPAETTTFESFHGVGVIKAVKSEGRVLVIDHQKIEGFMDAMEMPFALESASLAKGLKVGDTVSFTLTEKVGEWPITKIEKHAE